jgi:cyclase
LLAARDVDEIVFLDTRATIENRITSLEFVEQFSEELGVPFAVGGGINNLIDAKKIIRSGAEKVVIGDAFHSNPQLVTDISNELGAQAVVISLDCDEYGVLYRKSGSVKTEMNFLEGIERAQERGAGEILLQSIDRDGTLSGYDLDKVQKATEVASIPILASGGAGELSHFFAAATEGASGVCAGAFFQFTEFTPGDVREFLRKNCIQVRRP